MAVFGQATLPASPWEMAVATERWLVEGAGARFPGGMSDPASDDDFVFVDESWPAAFQARAGASVYLRVSPDTGCYDFEDVDGTVFWTVVPYAPLTWNWISPFRSPLRPDAQNLYSPFRLVREWRLTTPELETARAAAMRRAPHRFAPPGPVTNLCFTALAITNDVLFFTADWPTDEPLPESTLDLYGTSNLASRAWSLLSSHPATNKPAFFSVPMAALPWHDDTPPHVHDETCTVTTNVVLSPLDGNTVYTNVVYECGIIDPPRPPGFFNLGTRDDTDCDGLTDAFERLVSLTDPNIDDSDGDGLSDEEELFFGTDPLNSDTDEDGLSDGDEVMAVRSTTMADWIDTSSWTNRVLLLAETIDGYTNVVLPFSFGVCGASSNLSVSANGLVRFSDVPSSVGGRYSNSSASTIPVSSGGGATVAAFWDDLQLYANLASEVVLATSGEESNHVGIVEFNHAGFFGFGTNHVISFQVQFQEADPNRVRVVFSETEGRANGESATLGARCNHGFLEYAYNSPNSAFPNLCIEYRFGLGTNPFLVDTDGDGLSDSAEAGLGADPCNSDTDGDGVQDGEEVFLGLNPFLNDTDHDGDGLPYWREVDELWTDPDSADSDGDGLDDGWEIAHNTVPTWQDTDGDGLRDGMEVAIGTDPTKRDTDGDGLNDKWEWEHEEFDPLDPADATADWDDDGLTNLQEKSRGTDCNSPDTDGDGISDGAEDVLGSSPLYTDTDGDGLGDAAEIALGTNPNQTDSDGDGFPDAWEVRHGFDPLDDADPNGDADPDGDHLSNAREAELGTNPFATDTDGDGLSDAEEIGWASVEPASPFVLPDATNLLAGISDLDGGTGFVLLPFPIAVQNRIVCSNLAFGIDGFVSLNMFPGSGASWRPSDSAPLVVEAFQDDLVADPQEMRSELNFGMVSANGVRHAVLEYRSFLPYGCAANPTNAVSFQIDFAEDKPGEVRVVFFRADGDFSIVMPGRALGSSAEMRTNTKSTEVEFSSRKPVAIPGTAVRFRIGTGSDPLRADTDSDGIEDGVEMTGGTDPRSFDTDGDGMPDGWETSNGLDPRDPADGPVDTDSDGLSNEEEYRNGTNPHDSDTDGDGVSDGDEADQGSDPNDPADGGLPPESEDFVELPFHIYGDYAAWRMNVVGQGTDGRTFRFHTDAPGDAESRTLRLLRGNAYRITMDWLGSGEHRNPYWYCWEAQFDDPRTPGEATFESYNPSRLPGNRWIWGEGWFADNRDGLLTAHVHMKDEDGGNVAEGKEAILYIPKADLSICRLGASVPVSPTLEETEGSIVRILDPNRGETAGSGRGHGLALRIDSVYSDAGLTNATATLRLRRVTTDSCPGLVRLYRETQGGALALLLSNSDAAPESQVAWQSGEETLWLEFDRAGVIDVSLDIRMGATLVYRDTVRATGIPTDPNPGRIMFVNPRTVEESPYRDFRRGANSLATAIAAARSGDNIVVAALDYREFGVPLRSGVVLAGLGGRFSDDLASHPVGFDFTRAADVGVYGFASTLKGDGVEETTVAGFRMRRFAPCGKSGGAVLLEDSDAVSLERIDFRGNAATEFGGAVCLSLSSNVVMTCCIASNNIVDFDDRGRVVFDRGMGGAVAALESSLLVTNCLFRSNVAQITRNGGVPTDGSAGGGGDIYVSNGMLHAFATQYEDGRAGVERNAAVDFNGSVYLSGDGGSILIHGTNNRLTLSSCSFNTPVAYGNGGAISISKDGSAAGRAFYDVSPFTPLQLYRPTSLSGGCDGVVSNCTFWGCRGGWQGGAIAANGRSVFLDVVDSSFENCHAGEVFLRDGKGGGIAVCGGVQHNEPPENDVCLELCTFTNCTASGNGGALYVTIRGLLTLADSRIEGCRALNSGGSVLGDESLLIEGMGGAAHVSAGGVLILQEHQGRKNNLAGNTAASNGGGISVKSGSVSMYDRADVQSNRALGTAVSGHGNGGGVYVTTSRYDELFGAGTGAAILFESDGALSVLNGSDVRIENNQACRWGGGLFGGAIPPVYDLYLNPAAYSSVSGHASLVGATISSNVCGVACKDSSWKPAQAAFVRWLGTFSHLSFTGTSFSGKTDETGVYLLESDMEPLSGCLFAGFGQDVVEEDFQ